MRPYLEIKAGEIKGEKLNLERIKREVNLVDYARKYNISCNEQGKALCPIHFDSDIYPNSIERLGLRVDVEELAGKLNYLFGIGLAAE